MGKFLSLLGKEHAPVSRDLVVKIETTNACNGECGYCPRFSMQRPIGVMDKALYRRIVDECAKMGVKSFHLQNYGEPLLDPHLIQRISYAKEKGIDNVTIFSNGLLLNEELSCELIRAGLDDFCVSIDPPGDWEEDRNVRKKLPPDRIAENIRNFSLLKRERNTAKPRIIITATTSDRDNPRIQEFKEKWLSYADKVIISPVHNWGRKETLDGKKEPKPCLRLWYTLTVLWDGRVALCCVDYDGKYIMGDLKDTNIKEIWNSGSYRSARRQSLQNRYEGDILCRNCTLPNKDSLYWMKKLIFE